MIHGGDFRDAGRPRHHWRRNDEDVRRWVELLKGGLTIVHIAEKFNVAPSTVSRELHSLGLTIIQGHHRAEQLPLKHPPQFVELIDKGPDAVLEFVKNRVWGIRASRFGERQLGGFCEFVRLHHQGVGVMEIAKRISAHRSTVAAWRNGTDYPYLIRAASDTLSLTPRDGWKLLPMHLASGGGAPSGWIRVPQVIRSCNDVQDVISQISPLKQTYARARSFGLGAREIQAMRLGLFAYLLGIMVGDSGKLGGEQRRYASMNLDLQLTKKRSTNERLGAFVLVCANDLGLEMARFKDKQPTGQTALSKQPSAAYRWTSERSPLLAWMFSTGLGLQWNQTTTTHQVHMDWIFNTSRDFRIRFVQGVADSDGCVKDYVVEIASVPNSAFLARLLQSLGVTSAHVAYEGGEPLKTRMNRKQASALPVFNEFVNSYRYQKMASLNGS